MEFPSQSALYALLAANVYGTTNSGPGGAPLVRSERNTLPLPSDDWVVISERISSSGFMARAYREITSGQSQSCPRQAVKAWDAVPDQDNLYLRAHLAQMPIPLQSRSFAAR